MSTFERNQIQAPAVGLTIYNTSLQTLEVHVGLGSWLKLGAASSSFTDLFDQDLDSGISVEKNNDEDILRFDTAGSERMMIRESGNVGIGNSKPEDALVVSGTVHFSGALKDSSGQTGIDGQLLTATASGTNWVTPSELFDEDKNTGISVEDNSKNEDIIRFDTAGSERMRIAKNGNVGIGNSNPSDALVVSGTVHIKGQLKDSRGDTGVNGQVLAATATGINWVTLSELYDEDGNTKIYAEQNFGEDILHFDTAGSERMTIDGYGVGIGNSSPYVALDVVGTVHFSGALKDSSGDTGTDGQILSSTADGTNWVNGGIQIASSLPGPAGLSNGAIYFNTSNNTLNIFNNGNWHVFTRDSSKEAFDVEHNGLGYNEITSAGTGKIWLDRNMGATKAPASINDFGSYTATEFGRFYTWNDAKTACPSGFHLPTQAEWELEEAQFSNHGGDNHEGAWGSLKLTRTGNRAGSGALGTSAVVGSVGYYWSSVASSDSFACTLRFSDSGAVMSTYDKLAGYAVRCIKDD